MINVILLSPYGAPVLLWNYTVVVHCAATLCSSSSPLTWWPLTPVQSAEMIRLSWSGPACWLFLLRSQSIEANSQQHHWDQGGCTSRPKRPQWVYKVTSRSLRTHTTWFVLNWPLKHCKKLWNCSHTSKRATNGPWATALVTSRSLPVPCYCTADGAVLQYCSTLFNH